MSDNKSEKSSPGLTTEPEMKGKKKLSWKWTIFF